MFSSLGLFRGVPCPEGQKCQLPNCMYSHTVKHALNFTSGIQPSIVVEDNEDGGNEGPRKRQRVEDGGEIRVNGSKGVAHMTPLAKISTPPASYLPAAISNAASKIEDRAQPPRASSKPLDTAVRDVSPPPLRKRLGKLTPARKDALAVDTTKKIVKESLNPRLLPHPPAQHNIRVAILAKLHEQLVRLNHELIKTKDASLEELKLSEQELIIMALDEEEKAAKDNPSVYSNVIKLRIVEYKKMNLDVWKKRRAEKIALEQGANVSPHNNPLPSMETGLAALEEVALLPKLFAEQEGLQKFGYVVIPPSDADIDAAKKGIEAAQGWEQCDRCKTRFQVFAGRREEDGALTSGGKCTYHYGKRVRPVKNKTDASTGHVESTYSCCSETVGSSTGCTIADTHVFKVSEAKRLAAVLPFKRTPDNPKVSHSQAVCFDCEMSYTVFGMELVRLTATAWPSGDELIDVLVRPMGEILDLNSRFSGVFPEQITGAVPYSTSSSRRKDKKPDGDPNPEAASAALMIMESPAAARNLLFTLLSPSTPLIGHAIENDLIAARIVHPTIIDTVLLYPHPRGLPVRNGLKMLTNKHLRRNIQIGGAAGHDSREDAKAAGDLVRLKVGDMWTVMKRNGWEFTEGVLCPPPPKEPRGHPIASGPGGARPRN